MLKGIDPRLTPELLKTLAEMGHGDEIVFADANFTAHTLAAGKPVLRLPGVGMRDACAALLALFPLDAMVAQPVAYMQVSGSRPACEALERFEFYARVRSAFAIVQTGELQPWANFVFKKGVIAQALRA